MEIEVNEFVRLDNGNIGHVIAVEKGSIMLDIVSNRWVGMYCIKKHSQNLIDIIEERRLCEWNESIRYYRRYANRRNTFRNANELY